MNKATPFAFNFLYFAGFASLAPFAILYYQELGFSGAQISLIAGLGPLVTLVFSPLWTNIADATRRHKLMMNISLSAVILIMAVFPLLTPFIIVFPMVLLFNLFLSPVTSLADSATMSMLADERDNYGRIRLGGTIGWAIGAAVAGSLIQSYGLKMAFWGFSAMMILTLLASQGLKFGQPKNLQAQPQGNIRELLVQPDWILFLALAFTGGLAFASTAAYFSPYLKELGADESLIGISFTISAISEIPVFFYGDRLLKRFKPYGLLVLALVVTGLRSLLFAAATTPLIAIAAQLLQGLTFPALWVAGVAYADEHAPANLKSTAQGLLGAMTFGVGSAVGGFLGGFLLESIGGRGLFLVYGILVLVLVTLLTAIKKFSAPQHVAV
jgi:PPP family 3-phenylpropionic acid transporter